MHRHTTSAQRALVVLAYLVLALSAKLALGTEEWTYQTQPGDNLWDLSKEYLISMRYWRRLQRLNGITRPRHVPPGTRLRIPLGWLRIKPLSVTVLTVHGEVGLRSAGAGTNASLVAGTSLGAGDELTTGTDGNAVLGFPDGSQLLLEHNSHLILDTLNAYGDGSVLDIRLQLKGGRTESEVPPTRDPNSRYEIRTPAATSGVRGTAFRTQMDLNRPVARTEVTRGKVDVGAAGTVVAVPEHFGTVVEAGQRPTKPRPLLPAPALDNLPRSVDRFPSIWQWPALGGATGYRGQLSPQAHPKTLVMDETLSVPHWAIADLPDGEYLLRVRGIDGLGLEGLNATHGFTVDAHPLPPVLQHPPPGAKTAQPRPTFDWTSQDPCARYRLQLAHEAQFTRPVADLSALDKPHWSPEQPLPSGDYDWRVSCADPAGGYGPFSVPRRLTILPLPAAPVWDIRQTHHHEVILRWHTDTRVRGFRYQLAQDPGFRRIIGAGQLRVPQLAVRRPQWLPIYLRIRSVSADGIPGRYSAPQGILPPRLPFWARGYPLYTLYPEAEGD